MDSTASAGRWQNLGAQLKQRRVTLSPQWHNRGAFSKATGVDYRLVYDVEEARRTNFGGSTIAAIEAAYRLPAGAIRRFLDAGEPLPAADAATPSGPPRIERPDRDPFPLPAEWLREFGPDMEPHRREIAGRAEAAAAAHGVDVARDGARLEGHWVFPHDPGAARAWDHFTARGMSLWSITQSMALWRVFDAMEDQPQGRGAAGLPQAGLPRNNMVTSRR